MRFSKILANALPGTAYVMDAIRRTKHTVMIVMKLTLEGNNT